MLTTNTSNIPNFLLITIHVFTSIKKVSLSVKPWYNNSFSTNTFLFGHKSDKTAIIFKKII